MSVSYIKASQSHLKSHSPIQFHLSLVKGHSRNAKSLVTAWGIERGIECTGTATDGELGSLSLVSPSSLGAGLPDKLSERKPSHRQIKKGTRFVSRDKLILSGDLPPTTPHGYEKQIPSPIRQNGGNSAPDPNTAAPRVLHTKQDAIKWTHSGFYDSHYNVFLYYSQDLGDAYPTIKESQRLKITVLHYHQREKKKL